MMVIQENKAWIVWVEVGYTAGYKIHWVGGTVNQDGAGYNQDFLVFHPHHLVASLGL